MKTVLKELMFVGAAFAYDAKSGVRSALVTVASEAKADHAGEQVPEFSLTFKTTDAVATALQREKVLKVALIEIPGTVLEDGETVYRVAADGVSQSKEAQVEQVKEPVVSNDPGEKTVATNPSAETQTGLSTGEVNAMVPLEQGGPGPAPTGEVTTIGGEATGSTVDSTVVASTSAAPAKTTRAKGG